MKQDIEIVKLLDHPNIIKFQETYLDNSNIFIIMEYCQGGSLIDFVFQEKEVCRIIKQLLNALMYIHSKGIIIRNMHLRNIHYVSNDIKSDVKMMNF